MACARCGRGIYQTEDVITMNKIWHKCCFTCRKCKCYLDKCAAKIYRGEVFCENCYNSMFEELEEVSPSPSRPSRVLSSPSCSLENKAEQTPCCEPNFEYCKNYELCFPSAQEKEKYEKNCRSCSCSCIPDRETSSEKDPYYLTFPLPRELANYYNREHMKPIKYTNPPECCPKEKSCCRQKDPQVCIKIRTLSPIPPRGGRSPNRCRRCPNTETCFCSKCCPPSPPSRRKVCACCPRPTCRSPRRCSPARRKNCAQCSRCPPCSPGPPNLSCPPCTPSPCLRTPSCRPPCKSRSRCSPCPPRSSCPPPSCRSGCPQQDSPREVECTWSSSPPKDCKCKKQCCTQCDPPQPNQCTCNICQVKALCTAICVRCGYKVYAAERILVTSGAYHTCCFSCYCCRKLLDVKKVYENCGEIYCRQCYNNFFGAQYYGYGSSQIC